jgi:hypothetical protein
MRLRVLASFAVVACLLMVVSVFAQGSDPLSGTWTGDWGPSPSDRNDVTLVLKWDGKALTGNVTAGTNVTAPIPLQKTSFDPKTGAIHMEADASSRGRTVHYVIDGKVDKNTMTGSWNHDNRKGDFKITKK